jgi:hypothetical protein
VASLEGFGSSARVFKPTSSVPFGHGLGTAGASRAPWNAASTWILGLAQRSLLTAINWSLTAREARATVEACSDHEGVS